MRRIAGRAVRGLAGRGSARGGAVAVLLAMLAGMAPEAAAAISAAPASVTVVAGQTSGTVQLAITGADNPSLEGRPLTVSGLPPGAAAVPASPVATFSNPATGAAAFLVTAAPATAPGSYPLQVGLGGFGIGFTQVMLVVPAPKVTVSPPAISLAPGAVTGPFTVTVRNLSGRTLQFQPDLPAALAPHATVSPSPVTLALSPLVTAGSTPFTVALGPSAPAGSHGIAFTDAGTGLRFTVTVQVARPEPPPPTPPGPNPPPPNPPPNPPGPNPPSPNPPSPTPPGPAPPRPNPPSPPPPPLSLRLSPESLRLDPGTTSAAVVVELAGGLRGRPVVLRPENPPGLAVDREPISLTAPGDGPPTTASFRVTASPAATPGLYVLRLAADGASAPSLAAALSVEVVRPVEIDQLLPARVAQGAEAVPVRIVGRGFLPGARLEASPLLRFAPLRVVSGEAAETLVSVRGDTPAGGYEVELVNPDGSRSRRPGLVAVVDRDALTAPLGVQAVAVVHPLPGALAGRDERLLPRGLVAATGTGSLVGSWRLDGIPFDRFVVLARAGQPVSVEARHPVPPTFLGRHLLELVIESPQEVASEAVELVVVESRQTRLRIHTPAAGEVMAPADLSFHWSLVPGATGYQVEIERPAPRPPLVIRTAETTWSPGTETASALGAGLHHWRVRPVFAGETLGQPTERRAFALLPERVELRALPADAGADADAEPGPAGRRRLAWEGGAPGLLYRLELAAGSDEPVFAALVPTSPYTVPPEAPAFDRWRVVALGPGGVVVGVSDWQEAGGAGQARLGLVGPGQRAGYRFAAATAAALELTAFSPAAGEEVATAFPRLEARWQPAVSPDRVVLVIDGIDVTALAGVGPESLVYEALLPVAPGVHQVELRLGERSTGWSFRTLAPAADHHAGEAAGELPGAGDAVDPHAAERDRAGAVAGAAAGAVPPVTPGVVPGSAHTAGGAAPRPRRATWRVGTEGTVSRLAADELSRDEDTGVVSLSVQLDRQAEALQLQATGDVARTEAFSAETPQQESQSWLLTAGHQGWGPWSGEPRGANGRQQVTAGYTSPDFLFGSELAGGGLAQGGGQLTLGSGPLRAAYFRTFDTDLGGLGGGGLAPALELEAGALTWTPGSRLELRAFGLRTTQDAFAFGPGGEGDLFGLLATYLGPTGTSWTLEAARGNHGPRSPEDGRAGAEDPEGFGDFGAADGLGGAGGFAASEAARSGNAFRLAASGTRGAFSWGVGLGFTEDGFVNPANRGLTPASLADRTTATLSLSRGLASGGLVSLEVEHLRGGTSSGLDARDARQSGGRLQLTRPLRPGISLTLGAHLVGTEGGGEPELDLAATDRVDRGASLALQETVGRVTLGQSLTWQDGEDRNQPELANEVLAASVSAFGALSPAFSLHAQLDGLRSEQGGAFGATTESLLAALQPTWTLAGTGLSLQGYLALDRFESETAFLPGPPAGARETEIYRLTVSWAPPVVGRYLALQGGGEWSRTRGPGLEDAELVARYTAGVTLRWAASSDAPASQAALQPTAHPASPGIAVATAPAGSPSS